MHDRTRSMMETTVVKKVSHQGEFTHSKKHSKSSGSLDKMDYNEKLERYKFVIEREYELRSQLKKEYFERNSTCCHPRDDLTLVYDCGRKISHFLSPGVRSVHHNGLLTPPTNRIVRYRSYSDKVVKANKTRPLSADVYLETPSAVNLRKIASEERMGKRRASLRSLESDFEKAKLLLQRVKASSNDSLDDRDNSTENIDVNSNQVISREKDTRKDRPKSSYL